MRTPNFKSESTEAAAIGAQLRAVGFPGVKMKEIVAFATSIGIEAHGKQVANESHPRPCYTAYQAKRIFEEYASTHEVEQAEQPAPGIKPRPVVRWTSIRERKPSARTKVLLLLMDGRVILADWEPDTDRMALDMGLFINGAYPRAWIYADAVTALFDHEKGK